MIKNDEYDILRFLRFFGPLKRTQVCQYFENKINGNVNRIISNMCSRGILGYYDPRRLLFPSGRIDMDTVNDKMIAAFSVFLNFQDCADAVYPTESPSQIYFVKQDKDYEIVVISKGEEESVSKLLSERETCDVNYLIVIKDANQVADIKLKNISAFCTIQKGEVQFYKPEGVENNNEHHDG